MPVFVRALKAHALVEAARRVDLHHTKGDGLSSSLRFFYQHLQNSGADALALHVSGKIELAEKESAVGRLGLQPTDIFVGHGDDTHLRHVPLPGKTIPLPRHVEAELRDDVIRLRKIDALAKREVARVCRSQDWLTHQRTIAEIRAYDGRSSRHPAKAGCLGLAALGQLQASKACPGIGSSAPTAVVNGAISA